VNLNPKIHKNKMNVKNSMLLIEFNDPQGMKAPFHQSWINEPAMKVLLGLP
jgi:hypothetical protein